MRNTFKVLGLLALLALFSADVRAKPQRIVSLNLCVDQILIDLVPKERIAALSFLATDKAMSAVADRAHNYRRVRGSAENVLATKPDLIIAGTYSTPATRNLLQRLGKRVVVVGQPSDIQGIRALIDQLAALVGEPERGRALISAFDRRLGAITARVPSPRTNETRHPSALSIQVNSIVSMPGTLVDDAIRMAGLRNLGGDLDAGPTGRVPLETIVLNPPDIVVFANTPDDFQTVLGDNLRHPALAAVAGEKPVVTLPMWSTLCGTPYVATAVSRLVEAHRALVENKDRP